MKKSLYFYAYIMDFLYKIMHFFGFFLYRLDKFPVGYRNDSLEKFLIVFLDFSHFIYKKHCKNVEFPLNKNK